MAIRAGTIKPLDAAEAQVAANGFLVEEVGDLLMAGEPRLVDGLWVMSITAGNAVRGQLGRVGAIRVDAATGQVLFSEAERAEVKARARELAHASSS